MGKKILFALIPLILTIGFVSLLPITDAFQPKADSYHQIDSKT